MRATAVSGRRALLSRAPLASDHDRLRQIPVDSLPDGKYDEPMGIGTGAGVLFGNTGGVMEAAVSGGWLERVGHTLL
jgi:iron only hydrogenase large subunit-like protein